MDIIDVIDVIDSFKVLEGEYLWRGGKEGYLRDNGPPTAGNS